MLSDVKSQMLCASDNQGLKRLWSKGRMLAFEHASRTTKGARNYQEDTALFWSGQDVDPASPDTSASNGTAVVAVLADGMGGHAGGALASRMACESFIKAYAGQDGPNTERLIEGLSAANQAIADTVDANPMLAGMGSTLVGVTFGADGIEWVSVGDSPLLLYRRGEIALLNEDHSLAPELDRLAAAGAISEDEARRDPRRHMLRSAVTGDDIDLVDLSRRPLKVEPGDYIILASDGLQTLEAAEIERIIAAYADDGAVAVANALIRAVEALKDPHQDNATVVAVRLVPNPARADDPVASA
jgi:serine/threonine protein phosphatase PrpC